MALEFPANPSIGTIYSYDNIIWEYNGYAWDKMSDSTIAVGITGAIQYHDGSGGFTSSPNLYWNGTDLVIPETYHLDGDILGAVQHVCHNMSGVGLTKGYPVYVTGTDGSSTILRVAAADAADPNKMPAVGIMHETVANGNFGHIVIIGTLLQLDTAAYSINQTLYVSPGGGLTGIRPTNPSHLVQNIGKVGRSHVNTGSMIVLGPGRTNDIPNIIDGGTY